jgi:hypothetical protein
VAGRIRVVFGPDTDLLDGLVGNTVARTRRALAAPFNLPTAAVAFVNGAVAFSSYRLRVDDHLEFIVPWGRKGVGNRVWTGEEFCQFFKISPDDLRAWIAQGLKVQRCLDDSVRITETAVDEFGRGRVPEAPVTKELPKEVSTEEAAAILGVTKDTVLKLRAEGLLEFRNAAPPGSNRPVYRYPLESVVRLRTAYETDDPTPAVPREQPRRVAKGKRLYKYIDYD